MFLRPGRLYPLYFAKLCKFKSEFICLFYCSLLKFSIIFCNLQALFSPPSKLGILLFCSCFSRTRFCSWRDGSASYHIMCFHAAGDIGSGQLLYGATTYTEQVSLIRTGDDLWQMCTDYQSRYRVSGKVLPVCLLTMVYHVLIPCCGLGDDSWRHLHPPQNRFRTQTCLPVCPHQ